MNPASVRIVVQGIAPRPKGNKTAYVIKGRAVMVEAKTAGARKTYAAWEQAVTRAGREAMQDAAGSMAYAPFRGALALTAVFWMPRPASQTKAQRAREWHTVRPDCDKLLRAVLDPLKGFVVDDDALFSVIRAEKRYCPYGEPHRVGVALEISRLGETA